MKITFIIGLPGAGKTSYAQGTGCPITYDLDWIAEALDYGRGTAEARETANMMLGGLITTAESAGANWIQVIRTTPSLDDILAVQGHDVEVIEIKRDLQLCMNCRPNITQESWNRLIVRHGYWLKNNKHKTVEIPEERF